jgi:hypothetical protein
MPSHRPGRVEVVARAAAFLLAAAILAYGVFLLVVGIPYVYVQASLIGEPPGPETLVFVPSPAGFILVFPAAIVILGVVRNRRSVAWLGAGILIVFAILSGFSIGGTFLLPALALLPAIALGVRERRPG